jgi:molecular chaperone Hsp33
MASLPGKVLAQSSIRIMQTPRPERALAAYYAEGAQREVKVSIEVALDGEGRIATARGALIERMPDSDAAEFTRLASETSEGLTSARPQNATTRPLRFACRCSHEKVLATLAALPADERAALIAQDHPIDIYCHMCGKCHTIDKSEIVKM